MPVVVSQVGSNVRVPLAYIQVDDSRAGTALFPSRTLLLGTFISGNAAVADTPVRVLSPANAIELFGQGSPLHLMTVAYLRNDPSAELWALPCAYSSGSKFVYTFSPPASWDSATLRVMGFDHPLSGATLAEIVDSANAIADLPYTASTSGGSFVLTSLVDGNYDLVGDAQLIMDGDFTVRASSGGLGAPVVDITGLNGMDFDWFVAENTDSLYLGALSELTAARWDALTGQFGHAFFGRADVELTPTLAAGAGGSDRNNQHESIIPLNVPASTPVWTAAAAGAIIRELRADPARPLQTVPIRGIAPPPQNEIYTWAERNAILNANRCTFGVSAAGEITIERIVTTRSVDANDNASNAWLDVQTPATLTAVIRRILHGVRTRYARVKLADDGTRITPGSATVTPATIKADIVAMYATMEEEGLVENTAAFAEGLVVERDAQDRNRVNVLMPADLINQLRVFAGLLQFRV